MLFSKSRVRTIVGVGVGVAIIGSSVAYAAIPDPGGVIHACYGTLLGNVRVVDTGANQGCLPTENAITWNQTGPQGLPGIPGATGDTGTTSPQGDPGDVGPAGPQGAKGDTGPAGQGGASVQQISIPRADVPSGNPTDVASLTLPTGGTWLLTATLSPHNQSNDSLWTCRLNAGGATVDVHSTNTQNGGGPFGQNNDIASMSLDGVTTLDGPNATVTVNCDSGGQSDSDVDNIQFIATRVG